MKHVKKTDTPRIGSKKGAGYSSKVLDSPRHIACYPWKHLSVLYHILKSDQFRQM